ncbi:MAG: hypothetical protein QF675_08955, partial [SAR324 cluster bacterium]|nr:hypothetical protein [SAR324 cluster bacterium]
MKKFIYTQWDGSKPPFSLDRKEIVDKFMENIMKGMSPNMSLSEMIWDGLSLAGMDFKVMGLEEMVQELQMEMNELFSQYNLEKALDMPMENLKYLLAEEAVTKKEKGAKSSPLYEELPPGLLEKMKSLEGVNFLNKESQETFDHWQGRQDDILELYEFYGQYAHKFTGEESLDFDQAIELMRQ